MTINRHNYEEFFILYLDNELNSEERLQVQSFAAQYPDLKEELELLLQSKMVPDESLVFEGKEKLIRSSNHSAIDHSNYEEWLLLYADNELAADQQLMVEKFAGEHPTIQSELDLLLLTRLHPEENIIFPNKESLYRKEEKARVVAFYWKRIAVAASLLLAFGVTAILLVNKNERVGTGLASGQNTEPAKTNQVAKQNYQLLKEPVAVIPARDEKKINYKKEESVAMNQSTIKSSGEKKVLPVAEKQTEIATENKNRNNLPVPKNNPIIVVPVIDNSGIAINEQKTKNLTTPKENKTTSLVTSNTPHTSDLISVAAIEPAETIDVSQSENKSKLRGFFRKVTRTFEKTTNIKATDDDDRLLLGALAIKL